MLEASPNSSQAAQPDEQPVGEHWRYCLRCSAELINDHCKLRCPKCGYFMSCSDFDK